MSTKKFVTRHGIDANHNTISNVSDPVDKQDAATKNITDNISADTIIANNQANTALSTAQSAYGQANTATTNAVTALDTAQSAYGQANTALSTAQFAYDQANNATTNAGNAFNQANTALSTAQFAYDQANNATTNAGNAFNQANTALSTAQSAYNNSNTKFSSSGGSISGNVQIDGTLTVSGNVVSISANNLSIQDNMIYLNEGISGNTNPDLGFAGAYYDGIYHHAGFFRDASDGIWKVFDNYKPEPDASVWIDTSNNTFRIANFQANSVFFGKISTSSTELVANLNSNFVGGLDSSYIISAFNQANTALSTAQFAYDQANTATVNAANASNLSSGTVPIARLSEIPNSSLGNSSITINGTNINLGGSGSIVAGATITDDTSTNGTRYLMLGNTTSGAYTAATVSSTKLTFNPNTGTLTSTSVKTSALYDSSNRLLIIEDANGTIVWG